MDRKSLTHRFFSDQCSREATVVQYPDEERFIEVMRSNPGRRCRASISLDGEMAIWDADSALHSEVDDRLGTAGWIAVIFHASYIELTDRRFDKNELKAALQSVPFCKSLGLDRVRIEAESENMSIAFRQ